MFDLIYDSFTVFWEKFLPIIQELRKSYMSSYARDAEYLYDEMRKIASERGLQLPEKGRNLLSKYESADSTVLS